MVQSSTGVLGVLVLCMIKAPIRYSVSIAYFVSWDKLVLVTKRRLDAAHLHVKTINDEMYYESIKFVKVSCITPLNSSTP